MARTATAFPRGLPRDARTVPPHRHRVFRIVGYADALPRSALEPIPQPHRFDADQGTGIQTAKDFAEIACEGTAQTIAFHQHGKTFVAYLGLGRDASRERRAQVYGILDSLRVHT